MERGREEVGLGGKETAQIASVAVEALGAQSCSADGGGFAARAYSVRGWVERRRLGSAPVRAHVAKVEHSLPVKRLI